MLDPVTGELLAEDLNVFELPNVYAIGDTGPAGGIVFYVTDGGAHGLEAAPEVLGAAEWGCQGDSILGADGTAIGTGAQNTADILAGCGTPGIAAYRADIYTLNGYSDWFLPAKDELNELFNNKAVVGGFAFDEYWSSSEIDANAAWTQHWQAGITFMEGKSSVDGVRAIRAF
jgi:hypothetical protein